jgi:hypothetical protein
MTSIIAMSHVQFGEMRPYGGDIRLKRVFRAGVVHLLLDNREDCITYKSCAQRTGKNKDEREQ